MIIDTLGYVKRLEAAGIRREQAEAQAEALQEVLRNALMKSHVASNDLVDRVVRRVQVVLWVRTMAIILTFFTIGWLALRFNL